MTSSGPLPRGLFLDHVRTVRALTSGKHATANRAFNPDKVPVERLWQKRYQEFAAGAETRAADDARRRIIARRTAALPYEYERATVVALGDPFRI